MRAIVTALAACVLIAGCERNQPTSRATEISVRDDAGRTIALAQPAQRIVSLMPTVTDLVIALGRANVLIARTDFDADPRIADLPSIGGGLTPSVEWLAAQRPDLVISWPDNASRSLVGRIESVGIPVYSARTRNHRGCLAHRPQPRGSPWCDGISRFARALDLMVARFHARGGCRLTPGARALRAICVASYHRGTRHVHR